MRDDGHARVSLRRRLYRRALPRPLHTLFAAPWINVGIISRILDSGAAGPSGVREYQSLPPRLLAACAACNSLLIRARLRFCNFNDMRNVFWPAIFSFVKTDLINKCILPNPKEDPGKKEKDDWVTVISKSEGDRPS